MRVHWLMDNSVSVKIRSIVTDRSEQTDPDHIAPK